VLNRMQFGPSGAGARGAQGHGHAPGAA
jgi:hypothetical protein